MKHLLHALAKSHLVKSDFDHRLIRASMVIIFLLFGYQKWFEYEAQVLIPYISNGPLISWMYPAFGIRGASFFLGVTEWTFCVLLFWGFWNRQAGILGALGSCATFVGTVTIIPFMPNGWDEVAGGFPAMTGNVPFLMKDVALLAVSFYLLKHDIVSAMHSTDGARHKELFNQLPRKDDDRAWPSPRRFGIPRTSFRDGDYILVLWLYKVAPVRGAVDDPVHQP